MRPPRLKSRQQFQNGSLTGNLSHAFAAPWQLLGDSIAEVVADATTKVGDEPIHVAREGRVVRSVHYAFVARAAVKC